MFRIRKSRRCHEGGNRNVITTYNRGYIGA